MIGQLATCKNSYRPDKTWTIFLAQGGGFQARNKGYYGYQYGNGLPAMIIGPTTLKESRMGWTFEEFEYEQSRKKIELYFKENNLGDPRDYVFW